MNAKKSTGLNRRNAVGAMVAASLWPQLVSAQTMDGIERSKKIRIAIDPAAPPYSSKDTQLEFAGSEVDVARLLAKDWGLTLEIVSTTPANRLPYLLTDKADVVISTLSITPEREKVVDFSVPYSGIQIVVAAPRAMNLRSLADLANVTVATVRGSTNDAELTKAAPAGVRIVRFEDDATAITAIVSGQAQAYCTAPALLAPVNQRKPELAMESKIVIKTNLTGIGLPKGDTRLKDKLDAWVRTTCATAT